MIDGRVPLCLPLGAEEFGVDMGTSRRELISLCVRMGGIVTWLPPSSWRDSGVTGG
jgi:hypothetical protein